MKNGFSTIIFMMMAAYNPKCTRKKNCTYIIVDRYF